jgi:hypothetical protein
VTDDDFEAIDTWRWYIRYPLAIGVCVSAAALMYYFEGKTRGDIMVWVTGIGGLCLALRIAREAGCVFLVILAVAAVAVVGSWVFNLLPPQWRANGLAILPYLVAYGLWVELSERIRALRAEVAELREDLIRLR